MSAARGDSAADGAGLVIDRLQVAFPHGAHWANAVDGCSLRVAPGEILGLVGESGSGKSLTGLACLGLTPDAGRVSGSARLDGEELVGASAHALAAIRGRRIAMVFQNPMTALNPYFTVATQMIAVVRRHFGGAATQAREAAAAALAQAGLTAAALDRYPHQMSGGQLQRVMVAMAIACQPRILVADEPTTALDVTVQARILNLLRTLADQGMGILLVSHDLGVVAQVADRVAVMYCGSIAETGPVQQMYADTAHPYTRGLMQASPTMGMGRTLPHSIAGTVPDFRTRPPGCSFSNRCPRAQAVCSAGPVPRHALHPGHVVSCHFPYLHADAGAPS